MIHNWITLLLVAALLATGACDQEDERQSSRSGGYINPEQQDEQLKKKPAKPTSRKPPSLAQLFATCSGIDKSDVAELERSSRNEITQFCRDLGATKFRQGINYKLKPANIN